MPQEQPQPSPLIPHEAWYTSAVQVNAVIAAVAQVASITLRIVGRFTDAVPAESIELIVADLTQMLAIVFGVIAIIKRQTSQLAPLTLTAKRAADFAAQNPSILPADPTKITMPPVPPKESQK